MSTFLTTTIQAPNPGDTVIIGGLPVSEQIINFTGNQTFTVPSGQIMIFNCTELNINDSPGAGASIGGASFSNDAAGPGINAIWIRSGQFFDGKADGSAVATGGSPFFYLGPGQTVRTTVDAGSMGNLQGTGVLFNIP